MATSRVEGAFAAVGLPAFVGELAVLKGEHHFDHPVGGVQHVFVDVWVSHAKHPGGGASPPPGSALPLARGDEASRPSFSQSQSSSSSAAVAAAVAQGLQGSAIATVPVAALGSLLSRPLEVDGLP